MKLTLHTDYALRTLLYLDFVDRRATADEIAQAFGISKDHLVKVIQQLARFGFVRSRTGRHGGVELARRGHMITVAEVVEAFEGRQSVLDCLRAPDVCPLEPGCKLRKLLIHAEDAFFETLSQTTIGDLTHTKTGGLNNLSIVPL